MSRDHERYMAQSHDYRYIYNRAQTAAAAVQLSSKFDSIIDTTTTDKKLAKAIVNNLRPSEKQFEFGI